MFLNHFSSSVLTNPKKKMKNMSQNPSLNNKKPLLDLKIK